jgi:hypothetical protein
MAAVLGFQYSKTNVMHFLFNLLRINSLCLFRALLAHLQEALHKQQLVYCVRIMSAGCYQGWSGTAVPPEDEQVVFETCRGP